MFSKIQWRTQQQNQDCSLLTHPKTNIKNKHWNMKPHHDSKKQDAPRVLDASQLACCPLYTLFCRHIAVLLLLACWISLNKAADWISLCILDSGRSKQAGHPQLCGCAIYLFIFPEKRALIFNVKEPSICMCVFSPTNECSYTVTSMPTISQSIHVYPHIFASIVTTCIHCHSIPFIS